MAVSVQRGTKTLTATNASMTIVRGTDAGFDATVVPGRTLLLVTYRTAGTDINAITNYAPRHVLTDGDTITVTRAGTTNDVVAEWQLIQFESGQAVVQHATLTLTAALSQTASISAASLGGGRWIVTNGVESTQENAARHTVNLAFDSTTQISATRGNATGNVTVSCQVVEHVAATVETIQKTLTASTAATDDTTITAVDVAKTLLFGTARLSTSGANLGDTTYQMDLTSTTNFRITRNGTSAQTVVLTAFVVAFSDDTTVERDAVAHADGTGTVNTTVAAVTEAETAVVLSGVYLPWLARSSASGYGRAAMTADLTSTTNAQTIKGIATTAADAIAQTVQFGAATPGTGFVLDPESGATNGSGVLTTTATSDDALTANGAVRLITATVNGTVVARLTHRPA